MTCLGINNEGHLVFDYYHEDIDQLNGEDVYNGQNSTLWSNFRQAYADEIKECYQDLRNNGKLTYEKIIEYFIENGSRKWSASIYNEDSDYKYISMLRTNNDATNLYQIRGNGEGHLKYFAKNRLNYLDSKWYASDYANNYVALRIYTPSEWVGIAPNANITIVPFSNMYAGVRYKANGTLQQERVSANEEITFEAPNETFIDTETAIYGASEISSLGDLAPLYAGSINVSKASKLIHLKAGDATEGYSNPHLTELSVGTNKLLKILDVRNCPNLTAPLGLKDCPNIEEVYATGSGITGIDLPNSGYLKVLHLPETLINLTLKNQIYINDLQITGYDALDTLDIENCPAVDVFEIMENAPNLKRIRLAKVNWQFDTVAELKAIYEAGYKGVDDYGDPVDYANVSGKCHIESLTGAEFAEVKANFPYMTITYTNLTANLIFMSADGTTELCRQTIINGADGTDPVAAGTISAPTKDETDRHIYTYSGWTTALNGDVEEDSLNKVEADRIVYPAFSVQTKTYLIFMDSDNVTEIHRQTVIDGANGYDPVVANELTAPDKETTAQYIYEYAGWSGTINGSVDVSVFSNVTEDRCVYPIFTATIRCYTVKFYNGTELVQQDNDVPYGGKVEYVGADLVYNGTDVEDWGEFIGWSVPTDYIVGNTETYAEFKFIGSVTRKLVVKTLSGSYKNDTVETIGDHAFYECSQLTTVDFPAVTSIGTYAFYTCSQLTTVDFTAVTSIGTYAFNSCTRLTALVLRSETTCTLSNANSFSSTPIASGKGYIYVPRALVESYKTATNWSTYANQFRAIEDYPEVCGGDV